MAIAQVPSNHVQLPQDMAQRLMEQVCANGKDTSFAKSMLDLLEVTARISQLEELVEDARSVGVEESPETRKWKEISTMSAQFARSSLVDRQLAAIDSLIDLGARGGSLLKEASDHVEIAPAEAKTPPQMPMLPAKISAGTGGDSPVSAYEIEDAGPGATGAAPCVTAPPPGLSAPPGLLAPPGLEHPAAARTPQRPVAAVKTPQRPVAAVKTPQRPVAAVKTPQRPPPGLSLPAARQQARAGPVKQVKEERPTAPLFAASCMAVSLDAYSDED